MTSPVIDVACGVGYGSKIIHSAGKTVTGIDIDAQAIEFAKRDYMGPAYVLGDYSQIATMGKSHAAIAFEIVEHLEDPETLLKAMWTCIVRAGMAYISTPNEKLYPFDPSLFEDDEFPHQRHYTPKEFTELINSNGFKVTSRWCQASKTNSRVVEGVDGVFLVFAAVRV